MPRKASSPTLASARARRELQGYLFRTDMSVNALAKGSSIDQSTLQRFMTGRTKSVTPCIQRVLNYAQIEVDNSIAAGSDSVAHSRIQQALAKAWDGSAETAELLVQVIEALAPVLRKRIRPNRVGPD